MNKTIKLILLTVIFWSCDQKSNTQSPPNIILIVTDDQRWDAIGYAGNEIIITTEQDQLAKEGTYFKKAFVTTPICGASRATIITGLYERKHKFTLGGTTLDSIYNQQNYAYQLRKKGYKTGFFGKLGIKNNGRLTDSFSEHEVYDRNNHFKDQRGYYYKTIGKDTVHLTRYTGHKALSFIENSTTDQPFCLSISFSAPHAHDGAWEGIQKQYFWQEEVDDYYKGIKIPAPKNASDKQFNALPKEVREGFNRTRWYWRYNTPERYHESLKGYYRMIGGVDNELIKIRKLLKAKGIEDNTIIIWMGDNGYFLGERQIAGKWLMYDNSIRVPLIIFDPRVNKHFDVDDMVANVDLASTILDFAGIDPQLETQGNSLVPYVKTGKSPSRREELLIEHLWEFEPIPPSEAIRTEKWKFMRYRNIEAMEELYDLKSDPEELNNLANHPEHIDVVKEMQEKLNQNIAKYTQ
jgi:arylsulfatase A-like enzyme